MTASSLLGDVPIFGGLSPSTLDVLLEAADRVACGPGDWLCRESDRDNALYVIERGRVEVFKTWKGVEIPLRELGPGDCLGEVAFLAVAPRTASVRAVERTVAIRVKNDQLLDLHERDLAQYSLLVMNLAREVCRRLIDSDQRISEAYLEKQAAEAGIS